ncbi:MAG: MBOAT family protein [Clostridia bacterium]|nr:MBOAT family protein [Clostridia bacterium]
MSFTTPTFVIAAVTSVVLYYLIPKRTRPYLLLAASLGFYLAGGWQAMVYLVGCGLLTYSASLGIDAVRAKIEDSSRAKFFCKTLAAGCIFLCFGLLFAVKYWDWFAVLTADAMLKLGFGAPLPTLELIVPLGISFYTFKSVGYVIDVYRKKYPAERNFARHLLFVSYFPQIVQGPISRRNELMDAIDNPSPDIALNLKCGIQTALRGYLKKLVIADRAAVAVNAILGDPEGYGGAMVLMAILLYSIQLYCDFSGGIDMARGISLAYGVEMTENFRRPLFASSLADYWRRWHITLGSWMRDYVFYPLSLSKPLIKFGKFTRKRIGGKLGKILPTSAATFAIYIFIGIWHGASFKYIAFGFWNGILITASLLLEPLFLRVKEKLSFIGIGAWRVIGILRTNLIVVAGRYLTRAATFTTALSLFALLFTNPQFGRLFDGSLMGLGLTFEDWIIMLICALALALFELAEEITGKDMFTLIDERPAALQVAVIAAVLIVLVVFGIYRGDYIASEFIYKQY